MIQSRLERWLHSGLFLPGALFAMTLAAFGPVLFLPGDRIISARGTDLFTAFIYWRRFGFDQLRAGRIAQWDPHVFSGAPFMGNFQTALFYPPNWIYLFLPLAKAANWEIASHTFLLGLFMATWAGRYGLHPLARLLAASVAMFGGAFFLHVYAGHLPPIDAMAWAPLILLAADGLLDEPGPKWIAVAIFALAMQLLAGYPPVFFNTVFACALYGAARLIKSPHRLRTVSAAALAGAWAGLIVAAQVWTGLQTAADSTRSGGVSFTFASSLSFPPENLITLAVPHFFGNMTGLPYWGRFYLWEMCLFFGLTGLAMALLGAALKFRRARIWAGMATVLLLLAMGRHTPLLGLLYRYVPGFNQFRSFSKFTFQAGLFMAILAAAGMDNMLRSARGARAAAAGSLAGALMFGGFGAWLRFARPAGGVWSGMVGAIAASGESFLPARNYGSASFVAAAREFAGSRCLIAAAVLLLLAILFSLRVYRPAAAYLLAVVGIVEVFTFAWPALTTFHLAATVPVDIARFMRAHPGDYRILNLVNSNAAFGANSAIAIGADDIWGYDPVVLRRYAQFIAYSQGGDIDDPSMYVLFHEPSPMFRLLRLRFIFSAQEGALRVAEAGGGLPHLLLVGDWLRLNDPRQILKTLGDPSFDPQKTVVLETDPDPRPLAGTARGSARLMSSDVNSMTIAAETPHPALLLVTDTYARGWRAVALPGSSQRQYQVLPADYTLMAVPLAAGSHRLRLEYAPSGYVIGRWISLIGLAAYLAALGIFATRRRTGGP